MKKLTLTALMFLFLFMLAACSDNGPSPQDRMDSYVKQWNEQDFDKMYHMLSDESAETYEADQFTDRYQKIYDDLGVSNLNVSYKKMNKDELKKAKKNEKATFPITVKMDTIAGPISFDYEAAMVKQNDDDENWFLQWDPGYIFPEMKNGGQLNIQSEKPKRGEILDRNKMPLATNDTVHEIGVIPEKLDDNPDDMKEEIAQLLNMSVEDIDKELDADWVEPDIYVPLKKIPDTKKDLLNQLLELEPVMTKEDTGRAYPLGKAAAHLVGYIGAITSEELDEQDSDAYTEEDVIGKRGLEKLYEEKLKGEPGFTVTVSYKDDEEKEDEVLAEKDAEDGENIQTTIDADIQEKIDASYDGEAGTSTAIDPKTGETLALVSSPAFDPNEFLFGVDQDTFDKLDKDKKQPLLNRFSTTFAPGSVMKPISAMVGLKDGSIDPDEGIKINGLEWSNGKGWGDYKVKRVSESDGPVDLTDALVRSDNIYFAMKAIDMGSDAFKNGLEEFGFGDEIPFEYPITNSTISSSGEFDDEVQLANSSYGQGQIQISPIHLAAAYTTFLNDGNMLKPVLLDDEETNQVWQKDLLTSDEADVIQDALHKVVDSSKGTAKAAKISDFPVSGKTGTAELKKSSDEKSGQENGWFVGYPTDDQDILIAMMMENTEDKDGGSGIVAKKVSKLLKDFQD